jgi:UPF0755 protein
MKRIVVTGTLATLLMAAIAALWLSRHYEEQQSALKAALPISTQILFTVKPGTNLKQLANEFAERRWLSEPRFFYWYMRHKALPTDIKAGTFAVEPQMSVLDAVSLFVEGREAQNSFAIIEGWNFRQLRAALEASPHLEQTLASLDDEQVMIQLGRVDRHPEGMFLADTYLFPPGTTDLETLQRAHSALEHRLAMIWEGREEGLPLKDSYEALTLASIVEKETAAQHERALIAGVFVARLRKNMLLQTDPTVIYGLGADFDGNLRRRDLRADTPYNTYTRKGLPPTPIAIVGESALLAAVHPQIDGSIYFVSRGDGTHQFSRTYAEHLRAVRKYQLRKRDSNKTGQDAS